MNDEFEIRKLTLADAAAWREIRLEMLQDSPNAFGRSYEEEFSQPMSWYEERFQTAWALETGGIRGAFIGGRLVGTAGFFENDGAKHRHAGTIWGVYVKSEFRGRGISKGIIQAIVDAAKTIPHIEQIDLTVEASNESAKKVYRALGFKTWGTHPRSIRIGDRYYDEDYMQLYLNK